MTGLHAGTALGAVAVALVLQVSVLSHLAWFGVAPDLCLLVVVAAGLSRGPTFGMLVGFGAGLALDLVPPADHLAGRWALALVLAGYVAGRVRPAGAVSLPVTLGTVAVCSLVATSVFALSGLVLGDLDLGVPGLLQVVLVSLLLDVALAALVVPWLTRLLSAGEPERVTA